MSGNIDMIIGTREYVRYYVCGESETLKRNDKHFKKREAAIDHVETMMLKGFKNVQFYKNTKTYKTERLL